MASPRPSPSNDRVIAGVCSGNRTPLRHQRQRGAAGVPAEHAAARPADPDLPCGLDPHPAGVLPLPLTLTHGPQSTGLGAVLRLDAAVLDSADDFGIDFAPEVVTGPTGRSEHQARRVAARPRGGRRRARRSGPPASRPEARAVPVSSSGSARAASSSARLTPSRASAASRSSRSLSAGPSRASPARPRPHAP